jgi:hypothetical protein
MKLRLVGATALLVALAAPAGAQETVPPPPLPLPEVTFAPAPPPAFGARGQVVLSTDLRLSLLRSTVTMGGGTSTDLTLQPALDVFVSRRLSVGSIFYYRYVALPGPNLTVYGLEPRVGYRLPLSESFSFWPRVGLGYYHARQGDNYNYQVRATVRAHFLWHLTPHFFLGAGPVFQTDLISKAQGKDAGKLTAYGFSSILGGNFGGG